MIVPVGRNKKQIHQGESKNDLLTTNTLFDKVAIGTMPGVAKVPGEETAPSEPNIDPQMGSDAPAAVDPQLQNVMNSGGLNRGRDGLSPYLINSGEGDGQEMAQDADLLHERAKIQKVLGGGGFHMDLSRGKGADGGYTLKLAPERGMQLPRENFDKLLQNLMSALGAEAQSISDPDPRSGMVTISYRPKQVDKVMKPGRRG